MCGLGGYAGIKSQDFVHVLGLELDSRGGHAAGYVTNNGWATRVGPWASARNKFVRRASEGDVGIVHARFATCGSHKQKDAHPFEIRRNGAPVLYGAHNGMIDDADDSARAHGRPYSVDSRELFELIADEEWNLIQKLEGYGVVCWMKPNEQAVYLARLTESGEMMLCSVVGGGYVWGSTWEILQSALLAGGMMPINSFKLPVGQVFRITPDSVMKTTETRCKLARRSWFTNNSWRYSDAWEWDSERHCYGPKKEDSFLFDPDDRDEMEEWEDKDLPTWAKYSKWANVGKVGS